MKKKAILAGASGATGGSLLFQLLENKNYSNVLILVRRELRIHHPKLRQLVINFDQISDYSAEIQGDVVFCCLGTNKTQTADPQQYRKVNYQYPLDIAGIAKKNGAQGFHLISTRGADKNSTFLFSRTKGEIENDLKSLSYENIHIYRPWLLDATRKHKRFIEGGKNLMMQMFNPLMIGRLKRYRSIKVENIAQTMIKMSLEDRKGLFTYESDQIQELSSAPGATFL